MLYLLAIIFPPLAVLLTGKPVQAVLNFVLSLCLYVPGVIHAILVINESKQTKRINKQTRKLKKAMN
ncbi:YqaE/Pmp3 family membrane protein [Priestia megaterium]